MDTQGPRPLQRYEALLAELSPLELSPGDAAEQARSHRYVQVPRGPSGELADEAVAQHFWNQGAEKDVAEQGPGPLGGFFGRAQAIRAGVQRATSAFLQITGLQDGLQDSESATFACPFCLDNLPARQRVVLKACGDKAHGVCRSCMVAWVTNLVNDGDVSALVCPEVGCKNDCVTGSRAQASDGEIRNLLYRDVEVLAKYERFLKIQEDDTLRDCPYGCHQMVKPSRGRFGEVVKEMRCEACQGLFCFHHANAHVGRSCEEYVREQAQNLHRQGSNALQHCKSCPKCGIHSEHSGGCNHMTCKVCKVHWCWVCGEEIKTADPYRHFREGPCDMMALENQPGGELLVTAQLLRDRLPRLDMCMTPLHHLLWNSCVAVAVYCPAHYDEVRDAEALALKVGLLFSLLCCCCSRPASVVALVVVVSLLLLWPAAALAAAWLLVSRLLRPVILRRYEGTIPATFEYLLLTPLLASLACLRFCGMCRRACGRLIRRQSRLHGIPVR